jgi:hypothetical protein
MGSPSSSTGAYVSSRVGGPAALPRAISRNRDKEEAMAD